jgi:4-amino-4-deoxy-L-arabinose transferase-like glycosyltransferase
MYHLQGPRLFLEAGRIILLPENWQSNGPFTVEMLYLLGLAFGSDVFSQLIHLVYTICLLLATFSFARRFMGVREAWIAFAILLGIPLIPYLAALPNVDLSWALYEFLAMYALFIWKEIRGKSWLILAGLIIGWALGSKYFALGWAGILGLWVLWESRKDGLKRITLTGLLFGIPGLIVGAPWYIKNMVLSGNPLYPWRTRLGLCSPEFLYEIRPGIWLWPGVFRLSFVTLKNLY